MTAPEVAHTRLLEELAARGLPCESVDAAIRAGHLTDLDWCSALREAREACEGTPGTPTGEQGTGNPTLTRVLDCLRAHPGLTHMEITFHLAMDPATSGVALTTLLDASRVRTEPTPPGSRCALRYFVTEESWTPNQTTFFTP